MRSNYDCGDVSGGRFSVVWVKGLILIFIGIGVVIIIFLIILYAIVWKIEEDLWYKIYNDGY